MKPHILVLNRYCIFFITDINPWPTVNRFKVGMDRVCVYYGQKRPFRNWFQVNKQQLVINKSFPAEKNKYVYNLVIVLRNQVPNSPLTSQYDFPPLPPVYSNLINKTPLKKIYYPTPQHLPNTSKIKDDFQVVTQFPCLLGHPVLSSDRQKTQFS